MPEPLGNGNQLKHVPEIAPAFREQIRIIGEPALKHGDQGHGNEKSGRRLSRFASREAVEKVLETTYVVEMGVSDEDGPR